MQPPVRGEDAAVHPEGDREEEESWKTTLSYLIIAVSPWRMVMLSVDRCISTLRTGNPVGIRHSSLKKEACNCLQHDLRPTCILKERAFRLYIQGLKKRGGKGGERKLAVQTSRKTRNAFKSKAVPKLWVIRVS